MVTTPKAPSAAAAADKAVLKKSAVAKPATSKPAAAKKVATKAAEVKPVVVKPVAVPAEVVTVVKAVADKPAAKKAPAAKTKLKVSTAPKPLLSTDQRNHYVAVAAFYIAERRGFTLGNPTEDWLAAEAEVDRLIASGHFMA